MRLIDADALLRDIEEYHLSDGKFQHWVEVQQTIEQPHWIPCSERLPEKYDVVFATYETRQGKERFMRLAEWTGDRWISPDDEYKISRDKEEYVAWMPLPEPYKESENC